MLADLVKNIIKGTLGNLFVRRYGYRVVSFWQDFFHTNVTAVLAGLFDNLIDLEV